MEDFEVKPQRKEVYLSLEVIVALQAQANNEGRLLKNYMESILIAVAEKKSYIVT